LTAEQRLEQEKDMHDAMVMWQLAPQFQIQPQGPTLKKGGYPLHFPGKVIFQEILKSIDLPKHEKGTELDSGPPLCPCHLAAVWEWLHLKPGWAISPAYAYLKAVCKPALMMF